MPVQEVIRTPDHDGHWKLIISNLFEDFVSFFLPEIYPIIDFTTAYDSLEQELQKIEKEIGKKGKRYNDKLIKVKLKNGKAHYILIHIEVQSSRDTDFPERMFQYFYRIRDKYGLDITAIAVFTNDDVPKVYNKFQSNFYGTKLTYEYNAYKVKGVSKKVLLADKNPFALVVLAAQYLNGTKNDADRRFTFKKRLATLALEQNYTQDQHLGLLTFINFMLILPEVPKYVEGYSNHITKLTNKMINVAESKEMRRLANAICKGAYGETMQDVIDRKEAERKEEAAKRKEEAAKRKEFEVKLVIDLSDLGIKPDKIAEKYAIPIERVSEIIKNNR